jgi:hypothetical protein
MEGKQVAEMTLECIQAYTLLGFIWVQFPGGFWVKPLSFAVIEKSDCVQQFLNAHPLILSSDSFPKETSAEGTSSIPLRICPIHLSHVP